MQASATKDQESSSGEEETESSDGFIEPVVKPSKHKSRRGM